MGGSSALKGIGSQMPEGGTPDCVSQKARWKASKDYHGKSYVASPSTTISRQRPSVSGTGIPSIRWPHHSTVLHGSHGCQPYHLRSSVGMESTGISRPHVGHGRLARGRPRSSSQVGGFMAERGS